MPRIDRDETWRKMPDGSMRLIGTEERVVSDVEIAQSEAIPTLRRFRDNAHPSSADVSEAVKAIAYILTPPYLDPEPVDLSAVDTPAGERIE